MTTPTFDTFAGYKGFIVEIGSRLYEAAGRPADFKAEIQSCEPVDEHGYVVEIVTRVGDRVIPARVSLLGMVTIRTNMQ